MFQVKVLELIFVFILVVFEIEVVMDTECTNLQQHFDECFKFIVDDKTSGGGVLVHCFVGRSRR